MRFLIDCAYYALVTLGIVIVFDLTYNAVYRRLVRRKRMRSPPTDEATNQRRSPKGRKAA